MIRAVLRSGVGAVLLLGIMITGSIVLWAGTPLFWLWVGGHVQGATQSLGIALLVAFAGVVASIMLLAVLLGRLSDGYRDNRVARGHGDPGHGVLEWVLVVSAAIAMAAFVVWFFLFAGAAPAPVGISI